MASIDSTALNVALPALQHDLNAGGTDLLWIINGYSLMLASLLLVGGSLGDRFGRKRTFMFGIILFAAASFVCGIAPNAATLIAARIVQGIGGALMVPGSLALITVSFDDASRGRAIGTWSATTTIFVILGPLIGGWLATQGLWRGVFFINLPFALLALVVLILRVHEVKPMAAPEPLDTPGAVLATLGLAAVTFGFIQAPERGFTDRLILVALIGGAAMLIVFVVVEARSSHPMVPLHLFRNRTFSGTNLATLFLYAGLYGNGVLISLNLIQAQGYTATQTSLAYYLPFAMLIVLISRFSGAWADRVGARPALTIGPALAGLGFFGFALQGLTNGPADYWTTFFIPVLVLGVGMGITVAPLTTAVMGAVGQDQAGIASGINNAVSRAAGVLATAILGALMLVLFRSALTTRADTSQLDPQTKTELVVQADKLGAAQPPTSVTGQPRDAIVQQIKLSFVDAYRIAAFVCAGLAWLAAVLAFFTVPAKKRMAT
jgi:EmrB/QacA subfamily drug resistance transporter